MSQGFVEDSRRMGAAPEAQPAPQGAKRPETRHFRVDALWVSAQVRATGEWGGWQLVAAWPAELTECGDFERIDEANAWASDRIESPHRFTETTQAVLLTPPVCPSPSASGEGTA